MSQHKRRAGLTRIAVGVAAAGTALGLAAGRYAIGRMRRPGDPDADHRYGELRGRELTVPADDGVPLHVEVDDGGPADGTGLTVVFAHGWVLNQDSWHYQRRDLRELGRLVFWDQRGHGRSGRSARERANVDQLGRDLLAVLEATVPDGGPVVLVGHSMGGMTLMALADQHPEMFGDQVVGVALVATSPGRLGEITLGAPAFTAKALRTLTPRALALARTGAAVVERGRRLGDDIGYLVTKYLAFGDSHPSAEVVEFVHQMIANTRVEVFADFYEALVAHDKLAALEVLYDVPTTVIGAEGDKLTPSQHSRNIAYEVPRAVLRIIPQAGHMVMMECPSAVTDALRALIERARDEPGGAAAEERSV